MLYGKNIREPLFDYLEKMEWEVLKPQMCGELFERDYTLWDDEMEEWEQQKKK